MTTVTGFEAQPPLIAPAIGYAPSTTEVTGATETGHVRSIGALTPTTQSLSVEGVSGPLTRFMDIHLFASGVATKDSANTVALNRIQVSETADVDTTGYPFDILSIVHRVGAGATFSHRTFATDTGVVGLMTATVQGYIAAIGASHNIYATVNQGGDGTFTTNPNDGFAGNLFGGNDHPRLASGATNWRYVIGREINVEIESGASASGKLGLLIARGSNDSQQGSLDDAAIAITNKADAANVYWKKGLSFGLTSGEWPFTTTSTLIGSQRVLYTADAGRPTANYGIDFSDITFSTSAFASVGFSVDPDGDLVAKTVTDAKGRLLGNSGRHPGYVATRLYAPVGTGTHSVGAAPGLNSIRLYPAYIAEPITISALGIRVNTLDAGNFVQCAIYAADATTKKPTGSELVATGNIITDNAASVSAAASLAITTPGLYWFATNTDSATVVFDAVGASVGANFTEIIGCAAETGFGGSGSVSCGYSTPVNFGTWGNLTAAVFTEVIASSLPAVHFTVASVP